MRSIASALESGFPQTIEARPELVARHFDEAGLCEKAVGYWLRAGRLAAARSANVEAIAHLRSGLASLSDLPLGESRSRLELSLQLALGGPLLATKGFASSEVEAVYRRAQELSRELGQRRGSLHRDYEGLDMSITCAANLREIDAANRRSDRPRAPDR